MADVLRYLTFNSNVTKQFVLNIAIIGAELLLLVSLHGSLWCFAFQPEV